MRAKDNFKRKGYHGGTNGANKKRKPKRRKVRSKQKNIRKDTRGMHEKPKHLRVGASNYQGRPLTDETRAKLNLAPSKTQTNYATIILIGGLGPIYQF